MNMRKVAVAWAVITLVIVSAAFAQRPMRPMVPLQRYMCVCTDDSTGGRSCSACVRMMREQRPHMNMMLDSTKTMMVCMPVQDSLRMRIHRDSTAKRDSTFRMGRP